MDDLIGMPEPEMVALFSRLTAYAGRKIARHFWFGRFAQRGGTTPGGVEPEDIALSAIQVALSTRTRNYVRYPDLEPYLQSIIDSKISQMVKSSDNNKVRNISEAIEPMSEDVVEYTDSEAKKSLDEIRRLLVEELSEEDICIKVFDALRGGMKRTQIANQLGLKPSQITNVQKKMRRALLPVKSSEGRP